MNPSKASAVAGKRVLNFNAGPGAMPVAVLERIREVNAEVEAMGVKVLEQYAVLGQYDFCNILERNFTRSTSSTGPE